MAFASKGYSGRGARGGAAAREALWRATSGGRLLVVTDASPCAGTLADAVAGILRESKREVQDARLPAFWAREVLPGPAGSAAAARHRDLHPTCTLVKAGGLDDLVKVARAHASASSCRSSPSAAASPATRAS
jgi:hypothetical protein